LNVNRCKLTTESRRPPGMPARPEGNDILPQRK